MKSKFIFLVIVIMFLIVSKANSQSSSDFYPNGANTCGTVGVPNAPLNAYDYFGGFYKPSRSDIGNAPTGQDYFPVLVVFVQFAGEPELPAGSDSYGWHPGVAPDWMDSIITKQRIGNPNWWDSYNAFQLSDYFHEFSRGKLHILGQCVSIVLPENEGWYRRNNGVEKINKDIYDILIGMGGTIDWPFYDRWTTTSEGNFTWGRDGSVDMIYLVHRHVETNIIIQAEGFAPQDKALGEVNGNYPVFNNNGFQINISSGFNISGMKKASGIVVNGRGGFTTRELFLEVAVHEHGHYLFGGGHITYSKMAEGPGREFSFSPWESIKLGYIDAKNVNYNNPLHVLGDISSRYGSAGDEGEIIKIPIIPDNDDEVFLIANRQKMSDWDRRMTGDTVPHDKGYLKNINSEYGKGIYIYHIHGGFSYPSDWDADKRMDMECADGLWNWGHFGLFSHPDWNQYVTHPVFERNTVSYNQDNPEIIGPTTFNRDGLSISINIYQGYSQMGTWYSIGKPHQYNPKVNGTDRCYTNEREPWYSLEVGGDRWDAWKPGYNEIFSPFSSPNTNTWNNANSGLFIYISGMSGTDANINIYRDGYGGYNMNSILAATPPSRPMEIKTSYIFEPNSTICHPKITWKQNREPDMVRSNGKKKYIVLRALTDNLAEVPHNYYVRANIEVDQNSIDADFIDEEIIGIQSTILGNGIYEPYPLRYKVIAVDVNDDESVPSDFTVAIGLKPEGSSIDPGNNENPIFEPGLPKEFNLSQNYPNPFNPVTKINFALPKQGFVSLKIYDITGREIQTLVSEVKQAGYYSVDFNGSSLSSGVYFYMIKSRDFVQTKRMLMIK